MLSTAVLHWVFHKHVGEQFGYFGPSVHIDTVAHFRAGDASLNQADSLHLSEVLGSGRLGQSKLFGEVIADASVLLDQMLYDS